MAEDDVSDPALDRLFAQLQSELRAIAARQLKDERAGHTLQPTALVNEAYLKLSRERELAGAEDSRFLGAAADAMRRILIDHARSKGRVKRGGEGRREDISVVDLATRGDIDGIAQIDDAITDLEAIDPRLGKVVKLKIHAGLTEQEIGALLGVNERTVRREWAFARAWLQRFIAQK